MHMRTTIFIEDQLGRSFKVAAQKKGLSLSAFLVQAGRLFLAQKNQSPKPFRLVTHGQGGPLPGVQLDKIRQPLVEEDKFRYGHAR